MMYRGEGWGWRVFVAAMLRKWGYLVAAGVVALGLKLLGGM